MMTPMSPSHDGLVSRALAAFEATPAALQGLAREFTDQMSRGLAGRGGSLKRLRTPTRSPPASAAGTAARVGGAGVADGGVFPFTDGQRRGTAAAVFDVVAAAIGRVVDAHPAAEYPLGFVYSVPAPPRAAGPGPLAPPAPAP